MSEESLPSGQGQIVEMPEVEKRLSEEFRDYNIPERMHGGIVRYIVYGILPGDFLQAVISNNLREAVGKADHENIKLLEQYVLFFYNEAPELSWGSKERMIAWSMSGGYVTMLKPCQE